MKYILTNSQDIYPTDATYLLIRFTTSFLNNTIIDVKEYLIESDAWKILEKEKPSQELFHHIWENFDKDLGNDYYIDEP